MLTYLAATNVMLGVFNLIPAAPLDGGRILRAALWRWRGDRQAAAVNAARAGRVLGFVLIALGVLQLVTGVGIGGIWLALIGWFVVSAAAAEEQQARVSGRLSGLTVASVMTPQPLALDGNLTVDEFVHQVALTHRFSTYPLVDPLGRLVGLVTLNRVRARAAGAAGDHPAPGHRLSTHRGAHRAGPRNRSATSSSGCTAAPTVGQMVVDEQGRVIGVVSPTDLARALELADLRRLDSYPAPSGADVTSLPRHHGPS